MQMYERMGISEYIVSEYVERNNKDSYEMKVCGLEEGRLVNDVWKTCVDLQKSISSCLLNYIYRDCFRGYYFDNN